MRAIEDEALPVPASRLAAVPTARARSIHRATQLRLPATATVHGSRSETGTEAQAPGERILLLDQDAEHLRHFTQYLTGHGYRVSAIQDAGELSLRLQLEAPDLIVLEQRLGDVTGTEVLGQIRAVSSVPVIILTALSDPVDRIINLELGADDQVHKSVPKREIMARMRAVLRRMQPAAERPQQDWTISDARRDVIRPDGRPCGLTTAEFGILRELAVAQGEAVSRADLSEHVFGRPMNPGDRAVDTVICKLRQKLSPGVIVTVRPAGYAFAGFASAPEG
jgi:two-component system OmpR family response regulator